MRKKHQYVSSDMGDTLVCLDPYFGMTSLL